MNDDRQRELTAANHAQLRDWHIKRFCCVPQDHPFDPEARAYFAPVRVEHQITVKRWQRHALRERARGLWLRQLHQVLGRMLAAAHPDARNESLTESHEDHA